MPDEFDFFGDPTPVTQETTTEPAQAPAPLPEATPAIDPNKVAELERRLEASEKWKQDAARFFGGQQPQAQQPDPTTVLQQFVQDPNAVFGNVAQQAAQIARQEVEQQTVIQEMRTKYPHLTAFEGAISQEMDAASQAFQQKNGRMPSFKELVESSIEQFNSKLQGYQTAISGQQTASQLKNAALPLTPGSGTQQPGGPVDPFSLSQDQWTAYRKTLGY